MQEGESFLQPVCRGTHGSSCRAVHCHGHRRLRTLIRPERHHGTEGIGHYLDVPGATVGGLMAGTYKPRCSSWADAARAAASLPTIRGTIGDSAGIPKPSASRSTSLHRCFRLSGSCVRARHSPSATLKRNTGNENQSTESSATQCNDVRANSSNLMQSGWDHNKVTSGLSGKSEPGFPYNPLL